MRLRLRERFRGIRPRPYPYPFRAMLAINTDIDHTTARVFREVHRFLHTEEATSMGPGVGLDVADSMWFYKRVANDPDSLDAQIAYFMGDDWQDPSPFADELIEYVRAGWIDTLHSYGDFSQAKRTGRLFTREHALRVVEICRQRNVHIPVWANHGNEFNRQNVGDLSYMEGDTPGSSAYHADLFSDVGVRYVASELTGEDWMDPVVQPGRLGGGQPVWNFRRSAFVQGHPDTSILGRRYGVPYSTKRGEGILYVWHPRALHLQITAERLERLAAEEASVVLAQHLGSVRPLNRLGRPAVEAFRSLRTSEEAGQVLTTRTSRLLDYHRARDHLVPQVRNEEGHSIIDLASVDDPVTGARVPSIEEVRGITFYVPDPDSAVIEVAGRPLDDGLISRNPSDGGGPSIGIRWHDRDLTDHTADFDRERRLIPVPDGRLVRASHKIEACRQIGFADRRSGSRLLCLEELGGPWSLALAAANQTYGARVITDNARWAERADHFGIDPESVGNLVVRPRKEPISPSLAGKPTATIFASNLHTRGPLEQVAQQLKKHVRVRGSVYALHRGIGSHYEALLRGIRRQDWAEARAMARHIADTTAYRAGLGFVDPRQRVYGFEQFIRVLDMAGFRYLDEPGVVAGNDFAGYETIRDALLELNPSDSKKYHRDAPVQELLQRIESATWYDELTDLVDAGLPALVLEVLEQSGRALDDPRWAEVWLRASMKSGPEVVDPGREPWQRSIDAAPEDTAHLASGYASMVSGDCEQARRHFAAAASEAPHLRFLRVYAGSGDERLDALASAPVLGDPWWLGTLAVGVSNGLTEDPQRVANACSPMISTLSDGAFGEPLATNVLGDQAD